MRRRDGESAAGKFPPDLSAEDGCTLGCRERREQVDEVIS